MGPVFFVSRIEGMKLSLYWFTDRSNNRCVPQLPPLQNGLIRQQRRSSSFTSKPNRSLAKL